MTTQLREALHRVADDVVGYPVYERALATARRRRRRRTVAAAAAVLAIVGALVAWPQVRQPPDPAGPATVAGALPDRIRRPQLGALHVTDPPRLGAAAVVHTGTGAGLEELLDENSIAGVVAADADRYRALHVGGDAVAGEEIVLSPDGRRIAYPNHDTVEVVDLAERSVRGVPAAVRGSSWTTPVGWAPDGRRLAVLDSVPTDESSAHRAVLSVVDLDGGTPVTLATGDRDGFVSGFMLAFAPDGRRLAYQVGTTVTVARDDGAPIVSFDLPANAALAGKGAWTRDGTALTIAAREGDAWTLRWVDPATGRRLSGPGTPEVYGVTAIRLLGWGPDGAALVVALLPNPSAPARSDEPVAMHQRTYYGIVGAVVVYSLAPGAATPVTRMTAEEPVYAVDVADSVVAGGRTRTADLPRGFGPRFWFWLGLGCLLAVGILVVRRYREARRFAVG